MMKLGAKPAIRSNQAYDFSSFAGAGYLQSARRLIRSVRPRKLYEESCRAFHRNPALSSINEVESAFMSSLLGQGYAIAPGFFSKDLIDRIHPRVNGLFQKNFGERPDATAVPVSAYPRSTSHDRHLRFGRDRTLELAEPLVVIPDILDIVFHESLLKIASQYFRHIPRTYTVSVVRYIPNNRPKCLTASNAKSDHRRSLLILIDLADVDETRGPLVFIPAPDNLQVRTNLSQPSLPCRSSVQSPRQKWVVLRAERGSIIAVPQSGGHSAIWTYPADIHNRPRTSIMIDIRAFQREDTATKAQNRMLKWNFDRLTDLQKMFAYPAFLDEPLPGLAKVS